MTKVPEAASHSTLSYSVNATYWSASGTIAAFTSKVISSTKLTASHSSNSLMVTVDNTLHCYRVKGCLLLQLFLFVTGLIFGFKRKIKFLQLFFP